MVSLANQWWNLVARLLLQVCFASDHLCRKYLLGNSHQLALLGGELIWHGESSGFQRYQDYVTSVDDRNDVVEHSCKLEILSFLSRLVLQLWLQLNYLMYKVWLPSAIRRGSCCSVCYFSMQVYMVLAFLTSLVCTCFSLLPSSGIWRLPYLWVEVHFPEL